MRIELAMLLTESDPVEALAELAAAHRLGPPTSLSLALEGEALRLLGRLDEAETVLRKALELHPRDAFVLDRLARCRRAAGDERTARRLEKDAAFYGDPTACADPPARPVVIP
ncbi:MAG: tetratricopeptide repeat protein [Polyangiaceae bacterium]|nr:tetratricopeptide repeat protein [Polyangiaceae bacterium]